MGSSFTKLKVSIFRLDDIKIQAGNCTVEVSTNHLLTVASHHALTGCEVLGSEDRRGDDERYVRSVDVTSLKV